MTMKLYANKGWKHQMMDRLYVRSRLKDVNALTVAEEFIATAQDWVTQDTRKQLLAFAQRLNEKAGRG